MSGVHENYLAQKMPDPNMRGVAEACDWFCFADRLRQHIGATKNYSVYGYQQFGFVAWHFLFGNLVYPKIGYPKRGAEVSARNLSVRSACETVRNLQPLYDLLEPSSSESKYNFPPFTVLPQSAAPSPNRNRNARQHGCGSVTRHRRRRRRFAGHSAAGATRAVPAAPFRFVAAADAQVRAIKHQL